MSLQLAIREALKNPIEPRGRNNISRFAAVLTDGYRTFIGYNSYKTHPLQAKFATNPECIHVHAEISALAQAVQARLYRLSGGEYEGGLDNWDPRMYVARVLRDGTPGLAKPCPGCMSAILEFGIKNVEWTE